MPQPAYVDRRVSAIPATRLLSEDPRTLIDPRRQRIAGTLAVYRRVFFLAWALSQILVFLYLWRSGNAARLRDALKRRLRSPFALRFSYGFSLAVIAGIAALPASAAQYRVSIVFDQSSQPFLSWLRDGVVRLGIDAVVVGVMIALIMALVQRTHAWWVYSIFGIFVVSVLNGLVSPSIFAPLFNHYRPVGGPQAAALAALERKAAVDVPIWRYNASRQTQLPSAGLIGFGPTLRIVLGDTLFAAATAGEIEFAVAREIAHVSRQDPLRTTFVWTFLFVAAIAVGVLVADRIGFRRDDDPLARLALVGALAGLAGLVASPLYNVYSRQIETRTDAYALQLTDDPVSAVRSFVRFADRRFVLLCPPRWALYYFWTMPPLGTRIALATDRPDPCR